MIRAFKEIPPTIAPGAYARARTAQVIGDVTIGEESSVWMNVVMRADVNRIRVGRRTNIQDGASFTSCVTPRIRRSSATKSRWGTGSSCTAARFRTGAHRHGRDRAQRCAVGQGSIVAAGTLVPEGSDIPPRSLVMGTPGNVRRE